MAMLLAYAIVREDPPVVLAADDLDVLHWRLAIELVARTPALSLSAEQCHSLRTALVEERWADAVTEWIDLAGVAVDVYTDLRVWTSDEVPEDTATFELQLTPLFSD